MCVPKKIEHQLTENSVCPYCGTEHYDDGDGPIEGEQTCAGCGKYFYSDANVSVSYDTRKLDCRNGLSSHRWEFIEWYSKDHPKDYFRCRTCDQTEFREKKPSKEPV